MSRIRVNTRCVADASNRRLGGAARERIIEFMDPVTRCGGLISFYRQDDGRLRVEPYHLDPGVVVRVPPSTREVPEAAP